MNLYPFIARRFHPRTYWRHVAAASGLHDVRYVSATETLLGWRIDTRLHRPATTNHLEAAAEHLACYLGIVRVRIERYALNADRVRFFLDFIAHPPAQTFPGDTQLVWTPRNPGIPVALGYDNDGNPITLDLIGKSMLLGGNPGSGKSTAIRVLLAGLASQRHTALIGIDPKRVELSPWRDRFTALSDGQDAKEVIDLLTYLLTLVHVRAQRLANARRVTAPIGPEYPAVFLIVDEWAELGSTGTKTQRQEITDLLRRYVSLGRAVGCSAILATQRPTGDTVDPGTRTLAAHRLAFRCGDRWQAEAILGQGLIQPTTIGVDSPGYGYYSNGAAITPLQVYDLDPDLIPEAACPVLRVKL